MTYGTTLAVLADPTRRQIFESLRRGPLSVGEIAESMPISRPAVSQHLKALRDAALVESRNSGTRHIYVINAAGLQELRDWLDQFWDTALAAFKAEAEKPGARKRRVK